jgi:hypothetical protein
MVPRPKYESLLAYEPPSTPTFDLSPFRLRSVDYEQPQLKILDVNDLIGRTRKVRREPWALADEP